MVRVGTLVLGIILLHLSITVVFGQEDGEKERRRLPPPPPPPSSPESSDSLGDFTRNFASKHGEKVALTVFQEGNIEARIPLYIKDLSRRNRTQAKETAQIYADLQEQLSVDEKANEAWTVVTRGKAGSMGDVIDAAYRLDASLGEGNGTAESTGMVSGRQRRGFWRWLRRNWRTIVRVIIAVVQAVQNGNRG
ncbi:uncharacterized protein LOC110848744 isoform X2 [Folsomia candida]|uniref:Uncharacterized protein n=1 Tax=Folsomia candida TaxID=158441 RepID=A0A226ECQ7_FOLCA|nr:uncharacterized protein LOC110848744 isoform X2 [Folsomia candida]OXA55230.1 hypothetical protein Fcan01_08684 [Folsomia candida]